jgi:hypothetical protein
VAQSADWRDLCTRPGTIVHEPPPTLPSDDALARWRELLPQEDRTDTLIERYTVNDDD